MRHIPAMLALIVLAMLPAFASVETTVFDFSYRITAANDALGLRVDWVKQSVLITTKEVAPPQLMGLRARDAARTRALASARSSFAAYVEQMHLTAYASVSDALFIGYLPQKALALLGSGIQPVVETWDPVARTLTLVSAVPLYGPDSPSALAARMLTVEQEAFAKQDQVQWYQKPAVAKAQQMKAPEKPLLDGSYTGIILDCTKMHYTPVLLPKLIAENGTVLWGLQNISPSDVVAQGMMGYATSLQNALDSGRAGASPCIIRPLGTCGPLQGDLVLSDDAARQLASVQAASGCVNKLAVIALID